MPKVKLPVDGSSINEEELHAYVTVFTRSSDRTRYAFYTVIVVTVLILIANWNIQRWSWPLLRLRSWYPNTVAAQKQAAASVKTAMFADAPARTQLALSDSFWTVVREEYAKQFTSRAVFTSSPLPGVSIDVNDIGTIGGLALVLLTLVLALCIDREHENLYLAFFKIRRLAAAEGARVGAPAESRGESPANLLYHALAMTQVLASPPTLARWRNRGILHRFSLIFFLPSVVYTWVVVSNMDTRGVAEAYHADVRRLLAIQFVMMAILWLLSAYTWVNSRAMAKRWNRMFTRVNPTRSHFEQMGWWQWLQLWPLREGESRLHQSVQKQLVDGATIGRPRKLETTGEVDASRSKVPPRVKRSMIDDVAKELEKKGRAAADKLCAENGHIMPTLLAFRLTKNEIVDEEWTVSGTWEFSYQEPPPAPTAVAPPAATASPATTAIVAEDPGEEAE